MLFEMLTSLSVEASTPAPDPDKFGILDPDLDVVGVADADEVEAVAGSEVEVSAGPGLAWSGMGGNSLVDMSIPEAEVVEEFNLGVDGASPFSSLFAPPAAAEAVLWR